MRNVRLMIIWSLCGFSLFMLTIIGYVRQDTKALTSEQNSFVQLTREKIHYLVDRSFPQLKEFKIELAVFESEDSFFQTDVFGILKSPHERTYVIEVNPSFFRDPPGGEAIEAVLMHELAHILAYTQMSALELATVGFDALFFPTGANNVNFEKDADRLVLKQGGAAGLKAYRRWLYQHLDAKALKDKKLIYLQPNEIDSYVLDLTANQSG